MGASNKSELSDMMKFYLTLKEQYKDAIVFFRLGDFYECFSKTPNWRVRNLI